MTDGNSCYSREDAIYGAYKEQACTTKIADLTTDAQGNSNTVEVETGTYFIKEIKAPKGFVLDQKVHPVTVTDCGGESERPSTIRPGGSAAWKN